MLPGYEPGRISSALAMAMLVPIADIVARGESWTASGYRVTHNHKLRIRSRTRGWRCWVCLGSPRNRKALLSLNVEIKTSRPEARWVIEHRVRKSSNRQGWPSIRKRRSPGSQEHAGSSLDGKARSARRSRRHQSWAKTQRVARQSRQRRRRADLPVATLASSRSSTSKWARCFRLQPSVEGRVPETR